jgi:hypothetical protein
MVGVLYTEWVKSRPIQIGVAVGVVLIIMVALFGVVWSIITGLPLNPVISQLIAFLTGGGLFAVGGQVGATHYAQGANSVGETP